MRRVILFLATLMLTAGLFLLGFQRWGRWGPGLSDADRETLQALQQASQALERPVDFHGSVRDPAGEPIAGAEVEFALQKTASWRATKDLTRARTRRVQSDASGAFALRGEPGEPLMARALDVVAVRKAGYEWLKGATPRRGWTPSFEPLPDADDPAVFELRRMDVPSLIWARNVREDIPLEDGPWGLDPIWALLEPLRFFERPRSPAPRVWAQLEVTRDPDTSERVVEISVPAGDGAGLKLEERELYRVAAEGLVEKVTLRVPRDPATWGPSHYVYLRGAGGQLHARLEVRLRWEDSAATRVSIAMRTNPTGGASLEPDEELRRRLVKDRETELLLYDWERWWSAARLPFVTEPAAGGSSH